MKIWCIRVGKKWSPCKAADWVTTFFSWFTTNKPNPDGSKYLRRHCFPEIMAQLLGTAGSIGFESQKRYNFWEIGQFASEFNHRRLDHPLLPMELFWQGVGAWCKPHRRTQGGGSLRLCGAARDVFRSPDSTSHVWRDGSWLRFLSWQVSLGLSENWPSQNPTWAMGSPPVTWVCPKNDTLRNAKFQNSSEKFFQLQLRIGNCS